VNGKLLEHGHEMKWSLHVWKLGAVSLCGWCSVCWCWCGLGRSNS